MRIIGKIHLHTLKPGEFLLLPLAGPGFHPSNVMPLPFVWSHRTVGYMAIDSPKISSRWSHFDVPVSRMLLSLQQQLSSSSRTHGSWVIPFTLHISHIHSPEESIIRALMPGQNDLTAPRKTDLVHTNTCFRTESIGFYICSFHFLCCQ